MPLITQMPGESIWIGRLIISQANHELPRKISGLVLLRNATTPAQAIVGLFEYLRKNMDIIELPYRTNLSPLDLQRALRLLSNQKDIYSLVTDEPTASQTN